MSIARHILSFALGLGAVTTTLGCSRTASAEQAAAVREIEISVHGGYQPDRITATAGEHLRLKFTRHEEGDCTREVVFPSLGLRRELPPHQTVAVDLTELKPGEIDFACGMGMIHGKIVVQPRS